MAKQNLVLLGASHRQVCLEGARISIEGLKKEPTVDNAQTPLSKRLAILNFEAQSSERNLPYTVFGGNKE